MVRTQIYLTTSQQMSLRALSTRTGRTQSELIRKALDSFLADDKASDRADLLRGGRRDIRVALNRQRRPAVSQ